MRTPRWIAGVAIALIASVVFVNLGFWQLRRLDERLDRNELISSRIDRDAEVLREVLSGPDAVAEDAEWRNVALTGTYAHEDEVFLRSQSHRGSSGMRVLTPMILDDGSGAIIVDRGWVPLDTPGPPFETVRVSEPVGVTAVLRTSQEKGTFGAADPAEGRLKRVSRVDVERLQAQLPYPIYSMWAQIIDVTAERGAVRFSAAFGPAGSWRRPPPQLRRTVVPLHGDRVGRLPFAGAKNGAAGGRQAQGTSRRLIAWS